MLPLRYPLSSVIVLGALAATASVFMFIHPQYQPPDNGARSIDLSGFAAPAHGWTWQDGQPGYRFGQKEQDWNISELKPSELRAVSAIAAGVGVTNVLPLGSMRLQQGLALIVAGTDAKQRTCLGFQLPTAGTKFFCPPKLGSQKAFLMVVPYGPKPEGVFIQGIARGDIASVVWHQLGMKAETLYEGRKSGAWGTFGVTTAGGPVYGPDNKPVAVSHGLRLDFSSRFGLTATQPLTFSGAKEQLIEVR